MIKTVFGEEMGDTSILHISIFSSCISVNINSAHNQKSTLCFNNISMLGMVTGAYNPTVRRLLM